MITAQQLTALIPILEAQGFRWENSFADRAIFLCGNQAEIYWLKIYLQTEQPFAEVECGDAICRTIEAKDYAEFEAKIKSGVI